MSRDQSKRGHRTGGGGGSRSPPPSVPSIERRSNSFQREDSGIIATRRQHSATDEFGFPVQTQQLRSSVPHLHAPQKLDLEHVGRPSRVQQQRCQSSTQQQQSQGNMSTEHYYSQHTPIQSQSYLPPHPPSVARNSSNSSIPNISSKLSSSSRPPRANTSLSRQISNQSSQTSKHKKSQKQKPPRIKISRPDPNKYKHYTFQHPVNAMRVTVRTVDLSHRIAFDTRLPPSASSASLQRMLEEMDRVRGSRSTLGSVIDDASTSKRKGDNPCRISPSPNHVAILEFMHGSRGLQSLIGRDGRRVVRQLQWNVACSGDADPWFDGKYEEDLEQDASAPERRARNASLDGSSVDKCKRPVRRKPKSPHGDGRYVPIDPLAATKSVLPNHSPILTNRKRRLPMRSDVGFANPTKEEIAIKMEEVKREAEWEEASPRIVLLYSAFGLFKEEEEMDELHASCRDDAKLWAGGSIPGIPFAGRDLVDAYKMSIGFEKKDDAECKDQNAAEIDRCKDPRSYSVFAPPVDATFSSTQLWRPRPFMDRPPGFVYFLACPLDVRFEAGDVEPYFCTMALYSLPKETDLEGNGSNNVDSKSNSFCAKISEDFFFPAGDWNVIEGVEVAFDEEEDGERPPQSWRRRKRRAIMSYDPLEVSPNDLHLVIQVFRVIRPNEGEATPSTAAHHQSKKTIGSKIKRSFRAGKSKEKHHATTIESTRQLQTASLSNDDSAIGEVGARYLVPMCFSITPVFHADTTQQKHESASFYSFPDMPETHDNFVKRLASLVSPQSTAAKKPAPIGGYTDVFTSYLGKDFTRALLDEPPQLYNALDNAPLGPQLLADVMGDCAISFDGPTSEGAKKLRSKLRRHPPSRESGYSTSFDLKEVLYFPPRSPTRKYEDDTALCSSTLLNLLYIYPRLIRWKSGGTKENAQVNDHLSIRIRLVEQELPPEQQSFDTSDPTYHALQAVYNPSSPAGPPLVESFFTKLVKHQTDDMMGSKTKPGRKEIPLKDEVKLRLPDILDRRHFLQFSLLSVRGGADVEVIAETTIPFIISSKESATGGRVTTIIPNGLHRIQLDEGLQIHVETRLASSSHISDPSVATLLRDYPLISSPAQSSGAAGDLDSTSSSSDVIVHASSGFPFLDILNMASGQAVKRHFLSLATAHMLTLFNQSCPSFYFESLFDVFGCDTWRRLVALEKTDSLLAILRSLIEIMDKTRTCYQERDHSMLSLQYQRLLKSFLDSLDETLFTTHGSGAGAPHSENEDSISDRHFNELVDSSHTLHDGPVDNDECPSAMKESRDDMKRMPKYKITSPKNAIEENRSFSRKAFVATRSEQMRAEAELIDNDVYGEYLDDDQTVVTLGTITSRMDAGSVFPVIMETKSFATTVGNYDEILRTNTFATQEETKGWTCGSSSIVGTRAPKRPTAKIKSSTPFSFASKRAEFMANRVNNMAQLVMAPCIAPNVDDMISGGLNGSPKRQVNGSLSGGIIQATSQMFGGNKNPFEPSSDAEEEGETKSIPPYLRGNQSCLKIPPLVFKPMIEADEGMEQPYLYEMIVALWVKASTCFAASMKSESQVQGASNTWPYELVEGRHGQTSDVSFAFIRHLPFFLPLCLKSLGLRCAQKNTTKLIVPMTFVDDNHMQNLLILVETVSLGLMREAMSGSSGIANSDQMLTKALANSDCALDFLVGLFPLLHPSQVAALLLAYFNILEECEHPRGRQMVENTNKSHLRRSKCARQLRLHAVERLAAVPTFGRLNFPLKFTGSYPRKKANEPSWTNQSTGGFVEEEDSLQKSWGKVERFPQAFWLSDLLMNQCLSICSSSCKMIIMEAKEQAKAAKLGRRRDGSALLRDDLLRIESLAFHSIVCAYELLIKRQAMDARYQSVESGTRVAALFTRPVLQQSVDAVLFLARMDSDQKVRINWLLCLIYILQEGPDAMIRDELRRLCSPVDNRINDFVHLLKLANSSCQHFIPSDKSIPVLGSLSKETTQEAFNCLSATVILLIDECFDVVSGNEYELERLGGSIFDVLLHLLATPQSSITLLRTLGGSAHALDKFGAGTFIKIVGNHLQDWARIVLTMMNSTELSVRSLAVDFLVSLLGGIYQECGSIDVISLCMLSVLTEVAAREIALFCVSGLISMENAESSLWPLRRALADVEETNPFDDDRVDEELLPSLTTLCRTSQAIIDGVLVEIRLRGSSGLNLSEIAKAQRTAPTAGFRQSGDLPPSAIFDADEESVLEAASFFSHETSLVQKLRWLYTLRDLHVGKRQWSEVAECIFLCAHALLESLEYLPGLWQPARFDLWNDCQCSPWLESVGSTNGHGNDAVTDFANAFLEPEVVSIQRKGQITARHHLTVEDVCITLIGLVDQMEIAYIEEDGMEGVACSHFEELLSMVTTAINAEGRRADAQADLRRVRAHICAKLAKLTAHDAGKGFTMNLIENRGAQVYVRVVLHGHKPERFKESTGIPTFFEWDMPSICRVSKPTLQAAARVKQQNPTESWEECVCRAFARPLQNALRNDDVDHKIVLRTKFQDTPIDEKNAYISAMVVQKKSAIKTRKFFVRHSQGDITEYTVAHKFPHALSRQRSLITSEIKMSGKNN